MGWPKGGVGGRTSTLFVTGFAPNCNDRELENLCRFIPGFVAAVANMKDENPKVWVRFESPEAAEAAMNLLEGQPHDLQDAEVTLRASIAKTDTNPPSQGMPRRNGVQCIYGNLDGLLGTTGGGGGAQWGGGAASHASNGGGRKGAPAWSPPAWEAEKPSWSAASNKRPYSSGPALGASANGDKDTLCLLATEEKGYTEESLIEYFGHLRGYVTMKYSPPKGSGKGGSAFIKYESPMAAQKAHDEATRAGIDVQWARTNLDVDRLEQPRGSWSHGGDSEPVAKRPRSDSAGAEQDTLVVFAIEEKGFTRDHLEDFFGAMDGFITSRFASGRGGMNAFIKFSSSMKCVLALDKANADGIECSFAKTNLNIDIPDRTPLSAPTGGSGGGVATRPPVIDTSNAPPGEDGDTLCIMGVVEKGLSEQALIEFCMQFEGFYALRYSHGGKAGGTCFIKFCSAKQAAETRDAAAETGTHFEIARSSLNPAQATFVVS